MSTVLLAVGQPHAPDLDAGTVTLLGWALAGYVVFLLNGAQPPA